MVEGFSHLVIGRKNFVGQKFIVIGRTQNVIGRKFLVIGRKVFSNWSKSFFQTKNGIWSKKVFF